VSRGWNVAAALALSSLLAACTGGGSSGHPAHGGVTPTTAATTPAGEQVQRLAQLGLRASYHAAYVARQDSRPHFANWEVDRTPSALRIAVVAQGHTATLIVGPKGAFSCARAGSRRACFRVAKPGRPVPPPFDHAPQALFAADLHSLAQHPGAYAVTTVAPVTGGGRPADHCFKVRATSAAPKPRVPPGIYCFSGAGVLTAIRFPTGSTVRVVSLRMKRPPAKTFRPYASPTPLPG
jgi:hypothetical protein